MAKTANLYARIEPDVKDQAETILAALGIPASSAINMFYKQIILQKGIPFDVKIPQYPMLDANELSKEQMDVELDKGYIEMLRGEGKSSKETFSSIRKDYKI